MCTEHACSQEITNLYTFSHFATIQFRHTSHFATILQPHFCSPSGWTDNAEGTSACIPIKTPQQLSFVLTAVGTCNETTIQSVQQSLYAYLSDPTNAYGVYTPNLVLEVGCLETDAFQVGVMCEGWSVRCGVWRVRGGV